MQDEFQKIIQKIRLSFIINNSLDYCPVLSEIYLGILLLFFILVCLQNVSMKTKKDICLVHYKNLKECQEKNLYFL
jgi:hypothetical protein